MQTRKSIARAGYTLLEVMCVVAIIVIASAMAVPVVKSVITDARRSAAGDMVRARVADARAHAMGEGRPWRLSYLPGTGIFQLAPDDSTEWTDSAQDPVQKADLIRGKLPPEVVFAANQADIASSSGGGASGSGWQTIVVYLGDGSAKDDTTTYFGKPGLMPMRVRMRGLTGAVIMETPVMVAKGDAQK